jgi:uncharacterized repeat protein (TIGR03803 family)
MDLLGFRNSSRPGGSGIEAQSPQNFNNNEGSFPQAGVIRDAQGNLYGTTKYGGNLGQGIVFKLAP